MNWLDFTLIGVIATGTFFGIITGPLWQIYRLSSVALSAAVAFLLRNLTGNLCKRYWDGSKDDLRTANAPWTITVRK